MSGGRAVVYLWDAGNASGICGDARTAASHAERFVQGSREARVERAVNFLDEDLNHAYLRTGEAHVGRLGPGGVVVLWQPDGDGGIAGWVPPAPEADKPSLTELGIDPAAQEWGLPEGETHGRIQVAFPESDGWKRGDWVLMRVGGDPDRRVLVFDRREWACFLAGAANGEFDDAGKSSGHAALSDGVPGTRAAAAAPGTAS